MGSGRACPKGLVSVAMKDVASKLVVGTAALGMAYGLPRNSASSAIAPEEHEARAIVEGALAKGLTTFDTAPAYGESEMRLGRALEGRGRVWTKVGPPKGEVSWLEHAHQSLEVSYERLGRRRIELLQFHNWSRAWEEAADFRQAWETLRKDPRVEALGATTYGVDDARAAVRSGLFRVVQVEWNLLNQRVIREVGQEARDQGVHLAVRSVYLQGALTDEGRALPNKARLREGVEQARRRAQERNLSLTTLALGAALRSEQISFVLVGIDRPAQVQEALAVAEGLEGWTLEEPTLASLDLGGIPEADPRFWTA